MIELNKELFLCYRNWIENIKKGNMNDSILCIYDSTLIQTLAEEDKKYKYNKILELINLCDSRVVNSLKKNSNFILYFNSIKNYKCLKNIKDIKFLYIDKKILKSDRVNVNEDSIKSYLTICKSEPYDFLMLDIDYKIKSQIVKYYLDFFVRFLQIKEEIFLMETGYIEFNLNKPDIHISCIVENELRILEKNKIITSRLAIFIYRLFSFDIEASSTKIGRYFAEKTRSKSKVLTRKAFFKKVGNIIGYDFSAIRVYDLSVDEKTESIKKEIAIRLLNISGEKRLDVKTISEAVSLDIKIIQALEDNVILRKIKT